MADFLLELLSEEIPARMQAKARNDLARLFAEAMSDAGLSHGPIETFSTPRRLALIAQDMAHQTSAEKREEKGPPQNAADVAIDGFCNKHGIARDDLEVRDLKGRPTYFAVIERPGRSAAEVLETRIPSLIFNFPWPKSMRWGAGDLRWVRPLHNVLAILSEQPLHIDMSQWAAVFVNKADSKTSEIRVESSALTSAPQTVGHRFHHPGRITIGGAHDYVEKLRACHVIVDQDARERLVREGAEAVAAAAGLQLLPDEGLVVENAGLTEWPVPLLGRFDPEFLDVPREVIVLTMRTNQKYFACTNDQGLLAPAFICTANIDARDGGAAIVEGNRRVLAARLSDARFFWEQDLKVPLDEQATKLDQIVFHEKLGTVADKVERVAKLARWLVEQGIVKADPDEAERAARLAKADLVTGMVGEFPELQGVIGGYLAEAQGEPKAVADAVRDHYGSPHEPLSLALALADRLDSIAAFFSIDEKPTGSKDPFALRRAAISSIEMIAANGLRLPLTAALRGALANVAARANDTTQAHRLDRTAIGLLGFFADRLKVQQREAGVRHDLIDAVFALGGEDDLVRLLARVKALQDFDETGEGRDLLAAYKRAANILKKESWTGPQVLSSREEQGIPQTGEEDPLVLVEEPGLREAIAEMASGQAGADLPQEQALIAALDAAEPKASTAIDAEDFTSAMAALSTLRAPIDAFFDHVTVNDPDSAKRERRLNLLLRFRDAVDRVADFSKIEG